MSRKVHFFSRNLRIFVRVEQDAEDFREVRFGARRILQLEHSDEFIEKNAAFVRVMVGEEFDGVGVVGSIEIDHVVHAVVRESSR